MSFYLIIVIGFIFIIYYIVKNRFNFHQSREMEIIDSMRLANGESLYLLKVFDDILLLGGTKEKLNYINSWSADEVDIDLKELGDGRASANFDFKETLLKKINQYKDNKMMGRQNKNHSSQNKNKQDSDLDEK